MLALDQSFESATMTPTESFTVKGTSFHVGHPWQQAKNGLA
jgi:hypothetical protein